MENIKTLRHGIKVRKLDAQTYLIDQLQEDYEKLVLRLQHITIQSQKEVSLIEI